MSRRRERPPSLRQLKRNARDSGQAARSQTRQTNLRLLVALLPGAWVVLMFAARFDLAARSPRAVLASGPSVENILELLVFGLLGLLAIDALFNAYRRRRAAGVTAGLLLLMSFSVLLFVSASWSESRAVTLGKGGEAIAVALVAIASYWTWQRGERSLISDWRGVWIGYLGVVGVLAALALVFGSTSDFRFQFPGIHPVTTGSLLAIACVFGASMLMESAWNLKPGHKLLVAAATSGFLVLLLLTRTRSALFGLTVALIFMFATWSSRGIGWKALTGPGLLGIVLVAWLLFFNNIWLFLLRDQTTEQFSGGTGRSDLIEPAIEFFNSRPILGHGHGAGRFLFLDLYEWATHGHNLVIELAVDVGIVGLSMAGGMIAYIAASTIRLHKANAGPISHSITGWVITSVGVWIADPGFALVADSFVMTALVIAALSAALTGVGRAKRISNEAQIRQLKQQHRANSQRDDN